MWRRDVSRRGPHVMWHSVCFYTSSKTRTTRVEPEVIHINKRWRVAPPRREHRHPDEKEHTHATHDPMDHRWALDDDTVGLWSGGSDLAAHAPRWPSSEA